MKKMLAIILSYFAFSSHCLDQYNQNLKDLKKEINEVFGIANLDHLQTELNKVFAKIHPTPALQKEFNEVFRTVIIKNKAELDRIFEQANPPIDLQRELNDAMGKVTDPDLKIELDGILKAHIASPDLLKELNDTLEKGQFKKIPGISVLKKDFDDIFKKASDAFDLKKEFETVFTNSSTVDNLQRKLNDILKMATNKDPKLQEEFNNIFKKIATDSTLRSELQAVFSKATSDPALQKEFNEVFEKPIYLITITRSSKDHIKYAQPVTENNPIMESTAKIKEVLDKAQAEINRICHKGYKVIVFNEMFFSKMEALKKNSATITDVTHDSIAQYIAELNKKIQNSIVFYNVLYEDNYNIEWKRALYLYALTLFREKNWCLNFDYSILKNSMSELLWNKIDKQFTYTTAMPSKTAKNIVEQYVINHISSKNLDTFSETDFTSNINIQTIKSIKSPLKTDFLINRTYCVYKEKDIFHYNKSAYFKENDTLIGRGHIYNLGDGYPATTAALDEQSKKIFNTISTEICLDFACGIRKNNNWKNERGKDASKLHIIQSNSVETWLLNKENYPINVPILYSDANYNFPNFRVALGGMTHCLKLDEKKTKGIFEDHRCEYLYKLVKEIQFDYQSTSDLNITDHYTIWVHEI
jgi:hypothetical protein